MKTVEAERLAEELMRDHEPGSAEWDAAMAILLKSMRENQAEQPPRYPKPAMRSVAA